MQGKAWIRFVPFGIDQNTARRAGVLWHVLSQLLTLGMNTAKPRPPVRAEGFHGWGGCWRCGSKEGNPKLRACCLGSRVWGRIPRKGRSHACCFSGNSARLHETKKLPSLSGASQGGCGTVATCPTVECLKTIRFFPQKGNLSSLPATISFSSLLPHLTKT